MKKILDNSNSINSRLSKSRFIECRGIVRLPDDEIKEMVKLCAEEKILIIGAGGFIGGKISADLIKKNFPVKIADISYSGSDYLDLKDSVCLRNVIENYNPTIIIYLAAIRMFQAEENPDLAYRINVRPLEIIRKSFDGKLIFFSSNQIFSGKSTPSPYGVNDLPESRSAYGKTKIEAEKLIKGLYSSFIILRTGYITGFNGQMMLDHFTAQVIKKLLAKEKMHFDDENIRRPLPIDYVSNFIINSILFLDIGGIYQLNGIDPVTKYEWARRIAHKMGHSKSYINQYIFPTRGNESFAALDGTLVNSFFPSTTLQDYIENTISQWERAGKPFIRLNISKFESDVAR